MLLAREQVLPMLVCPLTGARLVPWVPGQVTTATTPRLSYDVVAGCPILVDFRHSVLDQDQVRATDAASVVDRRRGGRLGRWARKLTSAPKTRTCQNVARILRLLADHGAATERPRVLVVGGGSIGQGMGPLYRSPNLDVLAFDLFASPHVQFVADAHHIPLPDQCVDCVIVQAVLEHVLEPRKVVEQCWRVLRPGGLVYAETPFLQQVHEGAYDFTRFTESGHRYLFRDFALLASGASAGPGTQLLWTVDYFVRSLFRSPMAGKLAKCACFWLRFFDRLIPETYSIDAASGVFFLGRKDESRCSAREIVAHYRGAQQRQPQPSLAATAELATVPEPTPLAKSA